MILNVDVKKRVATYIPSDEKPVCGNSTDQVKFTFDEEWSAHDAKTARFKWNNIYHDVEFTGDTCDVPVITNAQSFSVGVFVGESGVDETVLSSTTAVIPCKLSVRCGKSSASNGTGGNYTNEARGYAAQAKTSADNAEDAAERAIEAAANAGGGGAIEWSLVGSMVEVVEFQDYTLEKGTYLVKLDCSGNVATTVISVGDYGGDPDNPTMYEVSPICNLQGDNVYVTYDHYVFKDFDPELGYEVVINEFDRLVVSDGGLRAFDIYMAKIA